MKLNQIGIPLKFSKKKWEKHFRFSNEPKKVKSLWISQKN